MRRFFRIAPLYDPVPIPSFLAFRFLVEAQRETLKALLNIDFHDNGLKSGRVERPDTYIFPFWIAAEILEALGHSRLEPQPRNAVLCSISILDACCSPVEHLGAEPVHTARLVSCSIFS